MNSLITFLCILLLIGCGSRKSELQRLKLEIKQQRELVLSIQNNIQSNVRITKVANKKTIEPVNEGEISTFNGTSFQNAKITIEETESDSTAIVNDKSKTDLKVNEESEIEINTKDKKTDAEKPNPWLWLVVLLVSVFLIWMLFKYKPWVKG